MAEASSCNNEVYVCDDCFSMFMQEGEFQLHARETDHKQAKHLKLSSVSEIDNKIIAMFELP